MVTFIGKGSITGSIQYFCIVGHLVFLPGQEQTIFTSSATRNVQSEAVDRVL